MVASAKACGYEAISPQSRRAPTGGSADMDCQGRHRQGGAAVRPVAFDCSCYLQPALKYSNFEKLALTRPWMLEESCWPRLSLQNPRFRPTQNMCRATGWLWFRNGATGVSASRGSCKPPPK